MRLIYLNDSQYISIVCIDEKIIIEHEDEVLSSDNSKESLQIFVNMLERASKNEINLDTFFHSCGVGFQHNLLSFNDDIENDNYDKQFDYWLWSTRTMQTWMYNLDDQIVLEISTSYPWLFLEPNSSESWYDFNYFIDYHFSFKRITIPKSNVIEITNTLKSIIQE
jgi:hypothetical protein